VIEAAGIPTMLVSTGRDLTAQVKPPRSLFRNVPMGNPFGAPGDADGQRAVLRRALELTYTIREPGTIVDDDEAWATPFEDKVRRSLLSM
jgi:hypothetical protein